MQQHDVPDDVLYKSSTSGIDRVVQHLLQARGPIQGSVPGEPCVSPELTEAIASLQELADILTKEFRKL